MTLKELTAEIESGAIDTIVVAFTDMQGRLMGKRVHSQFFLEGEVAEHGVEVTLLDDARCVALMEDFIAARPELWHEDIGEAP